MRIIQKYITIYLKNNNQIRNEYCKIFKNAPVNIVRDLARAYQEFHRFMPKSLNSTPLHVTVWKGFIDAFEYIFNKIDPKKLNLNPEDNSSWTPLHWAAFNGYVKSLKFFCKIMIQFF